LFKTTILPDQPWWVRRFVPAFLPLSALFASYALGEIIKVRKVGIYISIALIVFLISSLAVTSYPIITHSEGYGMIKGVSELSGYFKENDIVLMSFSFEGGELSAPLYYIYDKKIIYLYKINLFPGLGIRELQTPDQVSRGVDYLLDHGHDVYIVSSPDNIYMEKLLFYLSTSHKINFIDTHEFSYRHLEPTFDSLPKNKIDLHVKSNIYKVSMDKPTVIEEANLSIDIGTPLDVTYLENGFYGMEKWDDNITFRWTSSNATIRIPTSKNKDLMISVKAQGYRPENIPPANVSLYLNGYLVGNFTAHEGYEMHNMTAIKNYITYPYSTLQISSNIWRPSKSLENGDIRDLGIKIDEISVEQSR
jgi:hypothetical protein